MTITLPEKQELQELVEVEEPVEEEDLVSAIIRRAAERLSRPGAWTRGEKARSLVGLAVPPESVTAVSWCISGALQLESHELDTLEYFYALREAKRRVRQVIGSNHTGQGRGVSIVVYNDEPMRTQAEVVAILRKAAE